LRLRELLVEAERAFREAQAAVASSALALDPVTFRQV
jgi:hypothetical protein